MRAQIDLFLLGLARVATRLWFRRVQIVGRERLPEDGPVLVVGSHFNGLLDPALVVLASPRMPRFLAKAAFWRNPVAGRLLDLVGALPVQRASEGSTAGNRRVFEACFRALAEGQMIALFPEGLTHDEPRVTEVRTGAARIALGARDAGAAGLRILPVGLVYTAKQRPRSRALVRVGDPIDVDADLERIVDGPDVPEAVAVRRLTEEIRRRLADAALDYEHADVALAAAHAARVALRPAGASRRWEPELHDLERCARSITAAPQRCQVDVLSALELYADELALLGVDDADLVAGDLTPAAVRFQVGRLGAYAAAAPAAAVGLAVNGPAIGAVWAAKLLPVTPPMRATARLLTGLLLLPLSWGLLRWRLGRTALREPTLLTLAAGPGCGMVALSLVERVRALRSARAAFDRLRDHAAIVPTLEESRAAVVRAVAAALEASGDEDLLRRVA
jgi:glycerol-3-phosphate O-acyltransferase / dihydroxyacetone phosphate acyltransferase